MIKQKKQGQLIVISGPSGAGKGTIISKLIEKNNNIWLSVSATSRKPRKGEVEGVNYYYLEKEDFEQKITDNYFLEYAEYAGNYYGTPKKELLELLSSGKDVILEINIEGAKNIKEMFPEVLLIFIMAPSMEEVKKRIIKRGKESPEQIIERFKTAYKEINEIPNYNYVVINDNIENAVDKIEAIIKASKCQVDRIEEINVESEEEILHEFLIEKDFDNKPMSEKIAEEEQ